MRGILDADEILLEIITRGILIPYLTELDELTQLRTTVGPTTTIILLIEIEDDPNPLSESNNDL